jgi:hypothetical protein
MLLTPSLLVDRLTINAELAATIERSRDLVWLGRALTSPDARYRPRPPIGGGSDPDAALIVNALSGAALCLGCITTKLGVPPARAEALLAVIGRTVKIGCHTHCRACLERKPAFTLSTRSSVQRAPKQSEIIMEYLGRRRAEAFCAGCIAATLFAGKPVDNALRSLEGQGARRRHDVCSACGKVRLVSGLIA